MSENTEVGYSTAARDLVSRAPVFIAPDEPVRAAARQLWEHDVGLLVVGRPEDPVGVISERDVSDSVAQGHDPDRTPAREVMTDQVISVSSSDRAFELALEMLERGTRHLAVTEDELVVGVLSLRDVIRPLVAGAFTER